MAQQSRLGKVATTVVRRENQIRVTYHHTEIVTVGADGRVRLDSGGWRTATTKTRMNQAAAQFDLGYKVFQEDFDWKVAKQLPDGGYDWEHPIPFTDGMTI